MTEYERQKLTRRERQIMDALYRRDGAIVAEVLAELPDPPGYSSVRKLLELMESKGLVRHERVGRRYVYYPCVPREKARRGVLMDMLGTFFDGSVEEAVATLLDVGSGRLSDEELDRIAELARAARERGRGR